MIAKSISGEIRLEIGLKSHNVVQDSAKRPARPEPRNSPVIARLSFLKPSLVLNDLQCCAYFQLPYLTQNEARKPQITYLARDQELDKSTDWGARALLAITSAGSMQRFCFVYFLMSCGQPCCGESGLGNSWVCIRAREAASCSKVSQYHPAPSTRPRQGLPLASSLLQRT